MNIETLPCPAGFRVPAVCNPTEPANALRVSVASGDATLTAHPTDPMRFYINRGASGQDSVVTINTENASGQPFEQDTILFHAGGGGGGGLRLNTTVEAPEPVPGNEALAIMNRGSNNPAVPGKNSNPAVPGNRNFPNRGFAGGGGSQRLG